MMHMCQCPCAIKSAVSNVTMILVEIEFYVLDISVYFRTITIALLLGTFAFHSQVIPPLQKLILYIEYFPSFQTLLDKITKYREKCVFRTA